MKPQRHVWATQMLSLTCPIESPYHRLPGGLKLGCLCLATVVLFANSSIALHSAACGSAALLYAAPGPRFLQTGIRRLSPLMPFLLIIVVWHILTGTVQDGITIVLRMITVVGLANLVTMTTRLDELVRVAEYLLTPLKFIGLQSKAIAISLALVIRFTPILLMKGRQLSEAWAARSAKRTGWRILGPFTALAIDDAERVAEALRAKGGIT